MQTLKHIDVLSAAKVAAVLDLIIAIILAVILALFGHLFVTVFGASNAVFSKLGGLLIALPIIAFVGGVVITVLEVVLYNYIADKMGGIKIQFKGNALSAVDPWSAGKLLAIGGAVLGFLIGIAIAVVMSVLPFGGGVAAGVISLVTITVILALMGLLGGIVGSVVYNFLAQNIGGINLFIKNKELKGLDVYSYAKIEGILALIVGFFEGLIYAFVNATEPAGAPALAAVLGLASVIVYPIIYLVIGFLSALVNGWLYNRISSMVGGIKLLIS